jgi:hypothetical protein
MARAWTRGVVAIVWVFCTRGIRPFVVTKTPSDVNAGESELQSEIIAWEALRSGSLNALPETKPWSQTMVTTRHGWIGLLGGAILTLWQL